MKLKKKRKKIEVRGYVNSEHYDALLKYQAVFGGKMRRPVTRLEAVGDLVTKGLAVMQMLPKKKGSTATPNL